MRSLYTQCAVAAAVTHMLLCISCDGATGLPKSTGMPSEVLLAGDSTSIVAEVLGTDVVGLPQPEPMFDTRRAHGTKLDALSCLQRNIVVTDIDSSVHTRTSVRYERNVYARPQIIIYIGAPSAQVLRHDIGRCHIDRLLLQNELAAYAAKLGRRHATATEQEIERTFGCRLPIPEGMTVNKRGKNFVWLSDNSPVNMCNICIYTSENRDSVMHANIKGETDGMYMATASGTMSTQHGTTRQGLPVTTRRGLWQMTGDIMGGPFVSRAIAISETRTVVAEAFVYAPGQKKRDTMRKLEACIQAMRPTAAEHKQQ